MGASSTTEITAGLAFSSVEPAGVFLLAPNPRPAVIPFYIRFPIRMANSPCVKRLKREISAIKKAASEDPEISLVPQEDNIRAWTAYIAGPPETPYEGRHFELRIDVGSDYPLAPPSIVFVTKVSSKQRAPQLFGGPHA